jgi:Phytanoyl-CoA dioxygenase (PhyH)
MGSPGTGFIDSTDVLREPEALRSRATEEGYLYFKGLLPKDLVLELRRQILGVCSKYGWVDLHSDLMDGVGNAEAIKTLFDEGGVKRGVGISLEAYADVQRLELFHSLPHHPKLISIYRLLVGDRVLPHPRNIARVMLPDARLAPTPPHQDFIHIQGTNKVWTCWFPLGDCPRELGGLCILRGSHKDGLLPVKAADGAGGLEAWLCNNKHEWLENDYQAGDVLTFPSYTVHKALPNTVGKVIRLSCDYRFQSAAEEIEPGSLLPHYEVTTWEDIYSSWQNDRIKYYWKREQLSFSEWDESIRWQKVDIC